jgi:amino acid transporter
MTSNNSTLRITPLRKISGFTRPMSVLDAFIYNFLAMGVIFPWVYLWGPASFPGGNVEVALWLTLIAQIPISIAYTFLATALPVTGGDYVYQTRAFGAVGFVVVMSGFVVWILQWVALSGWLLCTLGLAPLCMAIGVYWDLPRWTHAAVWIESSYGISVISILLSLFTTLFLNRGMRAYVRLQKALFFLTVAAIVAVIAVFAHDAGSLTHRLDSFVGIVVHQLNLSTSPDLSIRFTSALVADVKASGVNLTPAFSWLATLGIIPIAWTSLQWATYSVEQNTEIENADKISAQLIILLGSAIAVAIFLVLVAHTEHLATGTGFVTALSQAYWAGKGSPSSIAFIKTVLQPFPNVLAIAAAPSIFLVFLIGAGFIANSMQVTFNSFIGVTRIVVQMSTDNCLPLSWGEVDPIRHAPVRAQWLYFVASIPVILGYNLLATWSGYTLGVTFACGYVFMFSCFAAFRLTRPPLKEYWLNSESRRFPAWLIKGIGGLASLFSLSMVLAYLVLPQLGITGNLPYLIVAAVIIASYLVIVRARIRSPLLDKKLTAVPADESSFYEDN